MEGIAHRVKTTKISYWDKITQITLGAHSYQVTMGFMNMIENIAQISGNSVVAVAVFLVTVGYFYAIWPLVDPIWPLCDI